MKRFILASVFALVVLSGCQRTTGDFKKAYGTIKYERCQKIMDDISDSTAIGNDATVLLALVISNCENTEMILEEIRKGQ